MKKFLLLLAIAVACSLPGFAQAAGGGQSDTTTTTTTTTKTKKHKKSGEASDTSAQSGSASESSTSSGSSESGKHAAGGSAATRESRLSGCIAKSADGNGFMLTNGRYKEGVAVKSSEDLGAHVGHQVRLTGTWEKPTANAAGGAGENGATMRTFSATAVKHVADTCSAAASGGKKGGKKATSEKPAGM